MAGPRASVLLVLFVLGVGLLVASHGIVGTKACPQYCLDVEYMTCQSSGNQKLPPRCNCCLAPKPCTLHLADGTSVSCN